MTITATERLVSFSVYDPANSLFKAPANERASSRSVFCQADQCALRDRGECACLGVLFGGMKCPYGRVSTSTGLTRRAGGYSKWIRDQKEGKKDVPHLVPPKAKLAFVGDWVFLPYAHMTRCEAVPFISHGVFTGGNCFVPIENWTVETVETLIDFRPQALFGGVIPSYQKETVPLFIQHIREEAPAMWTQLIAVRPQLDVAPNYVGRKAVISTLNAPISWTTDKVYRVSWKWDGKELETTSENAYNSTWGGFKIESMTLRCVPRDGETVVVQSNDWVNGKTQFTD